MRGQGWKKISSKLVFDHAYLKVAENTLELPDGKVITDYLTFEGLRDFVTVIPVLEDGSVLMIRELAYPINERLLQFPEGAIDPGESVVEAAARELFEETGYRASEFHEVGSALTYHRRSKVRQHVIVAKDLVFKTQSRGVENEQEIDLEEMSDYEVSRKMSSIV